jgi:hypothetical protein
VKLPTLHDLNVQDSLSLFFWGEGELAVRSRGLEPLLQALETCADEWMPGLVSGKRRRKYSREAVWKALEERRTEYSSIIGLYRAGSPAVALTLDLGLAPPRPQLHVDLSIQPLSFFAERELERCRKVMGMARAWGAHYPASYAVAHSAADLQLADFPNFGRDGQTTQRDGHDKVYEVFWLNVFGPRLVESVGRERMLSTPAHRVEALPSGAVLLVTWPTAADFASEEARKAQARALVHLRPDLDFDTVLRTLRERSATLEPVEPRFHPDVAPLLSRVVDDFAISERQRKIAELNAYLPPEPDEWFPAGAILPVDVADLKAVSEHYSLQAEHLVALMHSRVPSVLEETPESLTEVDYRFWADNFPETFERQNIDARAVPAVGAYLGEVLVRQLGGRWVPRKKLEEAQVVVGGRAWLPFVRAQRYMRSRQSLLDYSLTQFYRVAERHRG